MTIYQQPEFVLFVQHGWNDDYRDLQRLATTLAAQNVKIFVPNLGVLNTWIAIEPLIKRVEQQVLTALQWHPSAVLRVVGHSLGGLIWLDLLQQRSDILRKVESLVFLGSPIGGADLPRILDPFGLLPTIARDLGRNRRLIAEQIAQTVPMLIIAGDSDGGSDGIVTVGATQVTGATHVRLPGVWHNALRDPSIVAPIIRQFWREPMEQTLMNQLVSRLRSVPGMTDAHDRDFRRAKTVMLFRDGTTIRLWKNPVGIDHIFVADVTGVLHFGGFVGWVHTKDLQDCLYNIKIEFNPILQ